MLELGCDRGQLDALLGQRLARLAALAGAPDSSDTLATLAEIERESRSALEQLRAQIDVLDARTAAELHDSVAHAISVAAVQAGAARRSGDPAFALQVLATIRDVARHAHDEFGATSPRRAPIEQLIARSGLDIRLRIVGDWAQLDPLVAHTAYRVVQESITNALRHAPGAPVAVVIVISATALTVTVANGRSHRARDSPAGRGLQGMRDRTATCGGRLEAGPSDRGWRVRAWLPRGHRHLD